MDLSTEKWTDSMFRIGEFSKIAQISIRMLRHYDEIDLFKPAHIDKFTGYRYYIAEQLPDLNKILALKDLGLSLEQIARMMHENLSPEELRGMLMLKKAQTEQSIRDEIARLKTIETRIQQVEQSGNLPEIAIVLKSVPEQHFLGFRKIYETVDEVMDFMTAMQQALASPLMKKIGHMIAIGHDDFFDTGNMDLEMGYLVDEGFDANVTIDKNHQMRVNTLAPVEEMLCATYTGDTMDAHRIGYNAMGYWLDNNHYQFAGPGREIMLQIETDTSPAVTEVQFPVEKRGRQINLL